MGMGSANTNSEYKRRRRSSRRKAVLSEINVTPLVDVMLVLLIVFMVAAPLMSVGVPIDLPQTKAKSLNIESKPIMISVRQNGQLYLGENEINPDDLISQLEQIAQNGIEERIYLRADADADYGSVMKIMGTLSSAGYAKIGLISNQEQGK